jgi:hypothetical protein
MTLRVARLPFSLDPLLAEAKRRMRRRRLLVAAVLVLAAGGIAAGVIEVRSPAHANGKAPGSAQTTQTRTCGILGVGIGWHISASSSVSCRSGMTLMRAYFHGSLADRRVSGYACRVIGPGYRISCARGRATAIAIPNH